MENWKLAIFVREVGNQADIFRISAQEFNRAYGAIDPTDPSTDDEWAKMFSAFQSLLSAAAMISKLLWVHPVTVNHMGQPLGAEELRIQEMAKARAAALRKALNVGRDAQILQNRKVRNAIEHFDDRLDKFLDSPDRFWVVDHNIGNPADINLPNDGRPGKFLRNYDPKAGTVSVFDVSINLQELADAVSALDHQSRVWLAESQEPLT